MATGPEHYRIAERFMAQYGRDDTDGHALSMEVLAAAQVHATLALAAATWLVADGDGRLPLVISDSWRRAVAEPHRKAPQL